MFIGRTDAEAETPVLWPLDIKNWLIGKDPNAGKDWRQEKGTTEDEMVGWHHWLNEHKFEQTLGVGDGQGSLACCSPWGRKESNATEQLNWTESFLREELFSVSKRKSYITNDRLCLMYRDTISGNLAILTLLKTTLLNDLQLSLTVVITA